MNTIVKAKGLTEQYGHLLAVDLENLFKVMCGRAEEIASDKTVLYAPK
jgi:hypothetical protein